MVRYRNPSLVGRYVISETYFLYGEKEEKSRFKMFSTTGSLCEESVVDLYLREYLLFNPMRLMYLATMPNETSVPLLQSSTLIRGLP